MRARASVRVLGPLCAAAAGRPARGPQWRAVMRASPIGSVRDNPEPPWADPEVLERE